MSILGQIQFRRDTAINWSTVNPVLLAGELGIELDTDLFKIGDGVSAWSLLPYGGLRGATGDTGAKGDQGEAGLFAYEHIQTVASDSWLVNHNLGRNPIVSVYSVGGREVNAEVVHINTNQTQILFAAPQTGAARFI